MKKNVTASLTAFLTAAALVSLALTACGSGSPSSSDGNGTPGGDGPVVPPVPGTFTDSRTGQVYRTVRVSGLTWMAENLNIEAADSSWCYDDDPANCALYGRLYAWSVALTVCPPGWRLPTRLDWDGLVEAAGGNVAGVALKSSAGWDEDELYDYLGGGGNGTDAFGFSALPGGYRMLNSYRNIGEAAYWWTSEEIDVRRAWERSISAAFPYVSESGIAEKLLGMSVRCVQS